MALLVIAVPEFTERDYDLIQSFRAQYDRLHYEIVEPHFTLVFPIFDVSLEAFKQEVANKISGFSSFDVKIRCSTINKDAFKDYYHTFLVPDEGYSNLIKLHDALYSELFSEKLRLDIDFIPHIGVGNSKSAGECRNMVQQWNQRDFCICGHISKLQIVEFDVESNSLRKMAEIPLNAI